jgi:peptide/nickel transport system ATP-binding protein
MGIVGESGSGKTILSRSIMGLLPKHNVVREGQVLYEGDDIVPYNADQMRSVWGSEMAMVFQDPMTSLNPVMKVGKQITESLRYHLHLDKKEAADTAVALLASVGIPEPQQRIDEYPHQLSGGMRQRVTIAIALACGPKLLFADEPTTALDVTVQAQILNLLKRQQVERHMAMILVTHDLGVVAGRTDEIAVMYAGKIVEKAPTGVLFSNMKMPYTEALLNSIPKLDQPSHTKLEIIGGRPPDLVNPPPGCNFAPRCKYAQPKCHAEEPPLIEAEEPGHVFRCWFPVGSPEGAAALASNQAAAPAGTAVGGGA